jgi:beta-glucanase (GH16 family)
MPKDSLFGQWPTSGEIDIMEILGGAPDLQYTTLHYGPHWPNQKQIGQTTNATPGTNFAQDFHTFGVDWQPDHMDFYVDGHVVWSVKSTDAQWQTDDQGAKVSDCSGAWPFCKPYYLILNLAVGGAWPGAPDPKFTSFDYVVDYVRVYQAD